MAWLLLLTPVIAIAVIVWNYRRQLAAREKAASARFNSLLRKNENVTPPAASPSPTVTPKPTSVPAEAGYVAKDRLLTPSETLLYYLLRTGLPDHEVFARVSLSSLAEPTGTAGSDERDAQARRLAGCVIDFVICDKSMKAVAAVQFSAAGPGDAGEIVDKCLTAAGIRVINITSENMPKRDAMRALILGR